MGIMMPDTNVAPLVSHWARLEDTLKYIDIAGIIFAVTVVDMAVIKADRSSVTYMPVRCFAEMEVTVFVKVECSFFIFIVITMFLS